ncbi:MULTISPECIES: Bax inhibitor-1/YccA family protein [Paenibacillus]|uniref:Bax inhibitor-1/YccA family protein n=1 Tax=Paenibacillus arenosi TaxID=2774142 RepID=A0ABR9B0Y2_9BACL|nr:MULTISPECIES: Bax inhibitor-1/YccA family protein [Paenibacillus]MBD8499932.1 Bax inhibitor-1/YccA family protein [Paenibacillus arenosi]
MHSTEYSSSNGSLPKLFSVLFIALLISFAGIYAGQFVPAAYAIPLFVVEIGLLLAVFFLRKSKAVGYPIMFAFMFVSGITLQFAIAYYVSTLGATLVGQAFALAVVAFGGTALYAVKSKQDFSYMRGFLVASTLVLIGIMLVGLFVPMTGTMELIYSGFGILIFIGWTLFDFSRLTKHGFAEEDIPSIVVSIYLDFVNLFLFILRFIGASRD